MKYEKGTFVVVPNIKRLAGLGAGPQALYLWMCRFANQDGSCFPSRKTLADLIGCSDRTVDEYITVLVDNGILVKKARYQEKAQLSNEYWIPLGDNSPPIAENNTPPLAEPSHELNPFLTQSINSSEIGISQVVEVREDSEREPRKKADTRYLEVFRLFGKPAGWWNHKTQQESAKRLLKTHGIEKLKSQIEFIREHEEDQHFPVVLKPYDLESKQPNLKRYKERNGL